jgi:putative ABC transport system permease protein
MLRNYLKTGLRNVLRNKGYSLINISGLAMGMACCILILLFVQDELNFDCYHTKKDHIYRLVALNQSGGEERHLAPIGAPVGQIFADAFPEIQKQVRFYRGSRVLVRYQDKRFFEERFFYGDPTAFDVFSFSVIKGNPQTALSVPFAVVMTESMAKKYFGREDPVGRTIILDNEHSYNIVAVMRDVPPNSHFRFDFLASLETLAVLHGRRFLEHPGYMAFYTYLFLGEGADPEMLELKFEEMIKQRYGERIASMRSYDLQPLKDIHLHSTLDYEIEANSSISFIYIYSAIAVLILFIAAFNYMNLSTARSAKRAREVGIRRVLGALRPQLVKQFLGESFILSVVSLFLALIFVWLALPSFNSLTGKQFSFSFISNPVFLFALVGIVVAVGILGGFYPAIFLSGFNPIRTLKGRLAANGKSGSFRRLLVLAQFTISIILIIGTLVIRNQLDYLRSQNLGFNKEQVVVVPMHDQNTRQAYESIKSEFMENPSVLSVTASSSVPGKPVTSIAYRFEGLPKDQHISLDTYFVDDDFLRTLDIEVVAGRDFSQEFATDEENAFILNETAVRELSWSDPLNKQVIWPSDLRRQDAIVKKGQIVGVVKDFHVTSLHESIGPVLLQLRPSSFQYLSARISTASISDTLSFFKKKWSQFSPAFPFEYSFLDEDFDRLYRSDQKVGHIIGIFSLLAILVACLGLFGLASFAAEQRTKEIGIRKVVGSSVTGIVLLLSRDFTKWVLGANFIAWPIAYYAMKRWLENFAYRTSIGIEVFILSGLLVFVISLVTVSYQSIKAALKDPVDSLRYE